MTVGGTVETESDEALATPIIGGPMGPAIACFLARALAAILIFRAQTALCEIE